MLVALIAAALGYGLIEQKKIIFLVAGLGCIFIAIIVIFFKYPDLLAKVKIFGIHAGYKEFTDYRHHLKVLLLAFLYSLPVQVFTILIYVSAAKSIGINIGALWFFLYVPIIVFFSVLPISINGLGVREGAFVLLFAKAGIGASEAICISLLGLSATLAVSLLGAIPLALLGAPPGSRA
ncbi:MAG: lysylphosphatidylglycerol synthase domain-containing protein, partial [Candidatus Omnitrophota bacterium]